MAEAEESAAAVTETKKFVNSRVEIDTSPPFESVKEAVDHFGGGGPWIPHHMLRLAPNHHESEVINLDKVEEQASQLEKDLLKKKQETLHVLQELDAAKRFVESLKLNLMQEMSTFMAPEAHSSAGSLSWCPPAASPGSISMELNQAKINLGKTTTNLAVIQASVESLSRKIKDEQNLLDKVTERKAMDFYGSNMVPRQRCLVNDTTNGSAMNVSNDQQEPTFEAEQFKKMTEASKYEVMKAMSEIERTKTSIKMAEMRLNAARKMEEAAKAVEAIALAEKYTESSGISSHKSDGNGNGNGNITLSFEEYNALTHKAQQGEESSCRTKFIDSNVRSNQSEASIMKKLDASRRRKKSLEEVMGREDYFDRRIRGNGNNYSGETIENEQTQNEDQNAGRFRFKNSRLQPLDENENENESNLKTSPVYRSTISIGDILGRKLILQDDIVVGKHMERHAEREQVSLSQMLREQSGLILHPPPNSSMDQERGAEKQYYTQRKKFGFIHISIPRQSKKKAQRLKRLEQARKHPKRRLVISNATESSANGSSDGFPSRPGKIFKEEAIGAEYGEGFETFRPDGLFKVDVDFLNDKLQEGFLQRIRYAMKPDEAHGLIFSLDNVLVDTKPLKLNAWKQLASEEGKEIPSGEGIPRLLLNAGVEDVLDKVLMWEKSDNEVQKLKQRLSQLYRDNLLQISEPVEGLKDWLDAVSTARIPCAVVSSLDRKSLVETLERIGLMKYFQAIVSEEDGAESISHRFLSAAVKLDRKPSKCVVFEDDPRGITAAHNCTMMAIALIGTHPKYDLGQADLTVGSFHELSVINLRRLFAHRGSCFMDLQKQVADKIPPRRKLSVDTIF